jgi:hypothetical protein
MACLSFLTVLHAHIASKSRRQVSPIWLRWRKSAATMLADIVAVIGSI